MADSTFPDRTTWALRSPPILHVVAIAFILLVVLIYQFGGDDRAFPDTLEYSTRDFVERITYWFADTTKTVLRPVGAGISLSLEYLDAFLLALPWPVLVFGVFLLTFKVGGLRLALLSSGSLMVIGSLGLWESSIETLSIMTVSIAFTVLIGIPLGIAASRSDRFEAIMRPILDTMQTLPTFVYLIPVLLLFGLGAPSAVVATMIYAAPPLIRLTNLGIRQVPRESVEAAKLFGSSYPQMLVKVLLPLAKPSIVIGFNQTVMMALAMVVFVALIGASGLGKDILVAMRRLHVGQSLEAGLAVVLLAICLDRIGHALSKHGKRALGTGGKGVRKSHSYFKPNWLVEGRTGLVVGLSILAGLYAVSFAITGLSGWPQALSFSFAAPVDAAVAWMNANLGGLTDAVRYVVHTFGLGPIKDFLFWVPWPVLILAVVYVCYVVAGWQFAIVALVGWVFIGVVGMWIPTLLTLSQLIAALILSVCIAVPIGVLASYSNRFEALIRPVLDLIQTLPAFVYFPLVIMLFKVGDLSGTIITVIYAIPPTVRLTNLGLRQVPEQVVEVARSYGSTPGQILFKVKLPLALPSIMMGVNQTTMMCLAMVVYASLIGARGLGAEVLLAIGRFDIGLGFEAGLSIVFLAIIADRITQGWARKRQRAMGQRLGAS